MVYQTQVAGGPVHCSKHASTPEMLLHTQGSNRKAHLSWSVALGGLPAWHSPECIFENIEEAQEGPHLAQVCQPGPVLYHIALGRVRFDAICTYQMTKEESTPLHECTLLN